MPVKKKLTIAEYRKRKMLRSAEEAKAKIPIEQAKEQLKLQGQKQLRELEKEKEAISKEKQKKIANISELRDMYPEMNDADFNRFIKTQFGLEKPAEIINVSKQIREASKKEPIKITKKTTKKQLEQLGKEAEGEERLQLLAEAKLRGQKIEGARQALQEVEKQKEKLNREMQFLRENPIFDKYYNKKSLLQGKASGKKAIEREQFYKLQDEFNKREQELKKIKTSEGLLKKDYALSGESYEKAPKTIIKKSPAQIRLEEEEAQNLIENMLKRPPEQIVVEDAKSTKRREKLAELEARREDAILNGAPQEAIDEINQVIDRIADRIDKGVEQQPEIEGMQELFNEPEQVEAQGLNKKYAIHPRHIKEGAKNYLLNAKAKKHIANLHKILPTEKVNKIVEFSILNKARNDMQNLDKKFKGKKSVKGYKSHGGGLFSSLLGSIF